MIEAKNKNTTFLLIKYELQQRLQKINDFEKDFNTQIEKN